MLYLTLDLSFRYIPFEFHLTGQFFNYALYFKNQNGT